MARRIVLATTNAGKIREIRAFMDGLPLELVGLDTFPGVPAPEETGPTFAGNARLKALYYAEVTGLAAVAEDSGLEIDALGGGPGIESARFGGYDLPYPAKFELIARMLRERGARDRTARFVCAACVAEGGSVLFEARGTVEGVIADHPAGEGGFGYDPIFYYPPYGRTLAEASATEKAAVSHRGAAFRQVRQFLRTWATVDKC